MAETVAVHSTPSREVVLDPSLTGTEALGRISRTSLDMMRYHERLALDRNGEGVHQMRVATRRLRAGLSGFRKPLRDDYDWINGELRQIAGVLGDARDIDVFKDSLIAKAETDVPNIRLLQETIQELSDIAYSKVQRAIKSARYNSLRFSISRLAENETPISDDKLREIVPQLLDERFSAVRKASRNFDQQGQKKRHALRLALKKFRYTCELYGSLYVPDRVEVFITEMKRLQDDLGDANDVETAKQLVKRMVKKADDGVAAAVAEVGRNLIKFHQERVEKHEDRMERHLERLLASPPFWNFGRPVAAL